MTAIEIHAPAPHAGQRRVIDEARRFNVLMCGRRFGKTTLGKDRIGRAAWRGMPTAWFAPTYKLLTEVWRELLDMLAPEVESSNVQERQIRLKTGGLIDFWSLDHPDAGRGRKYGLVVIDEAGLVSDLEQAWHGAIRPTLADLRGSAWFLGTPKGRRFFYTLYALGQSGDPGWMSWRIPTSYNPFIAASEIEAARASMPEATFRQEFEGVPADDSGNPFGMDAIKDCASMPLTPGPAVAKGWDLAKSVDWTVGIGLDAQGCVCEFDRFQLGWEETEAKILAETACRSLVDSTGVGDPILERLQRKSALFEGFKFTSTSKQQLMDGLRAAIQRREIRFPDGPIRDELETFEYQYGATGVKYTAPQGLHDDCVMALALAYRQWQALAYRADPLLVTEIIDEARMAALVKEERAREAAILAEEMAKAGMAATVEDEDRGWRSF